MNSVFETERAFKKQICEQAEKIALARSELRKFEQRLQKAWLCREAKLLVRTTDALVERCTELEDRLLRLNAAVEEAEAAAFKTENLTV